MSVPTALPKPERLVSLDAYRGFVMFLMAAEVLRLPDLAAHFPNNPFWDFVSFHNKHVAWTWGSLHDMIQPSFSFMVGVALPFSMASRAAQEQSSLRMWCHALWRSLVLIMLGVLLRSIGKPMLNWTFEDTLSQIGLGYPFLFALGFCGSKRRSLALLLILGGYWAFFANYSPPPDYNPAQANIPAEWKDNLTGFASHWNINNNAAWAFDRWFMNLFPRVKEFIGNPGGYSTLSFIPTLGTMILGLFAGQWLKDRANPINTLLKLLAAGAVCFALGILVHSVGLCPIVKKIWTPSWTLFSGGLCFWLMMLFYGLTDAIGRKAWVYPLVVIGANSIAMYCMAHLFENFFRELLNTVFHKGWAQSLAGDVWGNTVQGAAVLLILWLIVQWMYRRKIFLRV
jgi:predicted acyltransferase